MTIILGISTALSSPLQWRDLPLIYEKITARQLVNLGALSALSGLVLSQSDFAVVDQQQNLLPLINDQQCIDPQLSQHFLLRVVILAQLVELGQRQLTRVALIDFHTRYKLLFLAHSQKLYREIGPFVAAMKHQSLTNFFTQYHHKVARILRLPATRANHTNVLAHMQGYFRDKISSQQRQQLTETIERYNQGLLDLAQPIALIKAYLDEYPDSYLLQQQYWNFYPEMSNDGNTFGLVS